MHSRFHDTSRIQAGLDALPDIDPIFRECLAVGGPLSVTLRPPGFTALIRIILDQQVSTASAQAMWRRLSELLEPVTPEGLLALDDATLKACGFSRQKTVYARGVARAILDGALDLRAVVRHPTSLTELLGTGSRKPLILANRR